MARFFGAVGFSEGQVEKQRGRFVDVVVEHNYYGDIVRNTRQLETGEKINNDLSVNNSISILADAYAREHFFAMRYVRWAGVRWIVSEVDASSHPRLILRLGGIYNGPEPAGTSTPTAP